MVIIQDKKYTGITSHASALATAKIRILSAPTTLLNLVDERQ
ncbi:ORFL42W [Human betaherpesvirus 5]|nr:ORFL42W [Human betaherpesvirus 5]QHX40338.1 ORFL42W [Human betaherpesvirus 5]